ncbi:MAG: carboxypeptidase regulatory-like domain-containing protein, partial [Acidobacteriota bacterium]|nr:carboxypeptidase regulatory-like domain-containing protein [Acidobacteriota bacterium]
RLFVTEQGDSRLLILDTATFTTVATIAVDDRPSGVAITEDGATLIISHLLAGTLSVIGLDPPVQPHVVPLWPDSNLVQSIVLSPDSAIAYLPHTRSNTTNPALTFDTTVFPLVSLVDLTTGQHLVGQQISLDSVDPPGVGLPFDAALMPGGEILYVVNAASNDVTVVDLLNRQGLAHIEVEDNPRGIAISPDGATAYVNNTLAGTVSVIDTTSNTVTATIDVTTIPMPPALLLGKRLFHSSDDPRLARDQWIACNTCHFDGEHDGRTWIFGFAGPRNTTTLHGMIQSYPLRWSAEWDESADSDFAVRKEQFGAGLIVGEMHDPLGDPNTGRSYELDCLAAFADSLIMPENRIRETLDQDAIGRGKILFDDPVVGCLDCHPPPYFTDFTVHDVGTADGPGERLGPEIDTPTLRDLHRSAPYLHDGNADTLADVLTVGNPGDEHGVTSHLAQTDLEDLVVYMLSLPANNSACLSCDGGDEPSTTGMITHGRGIAAVCAHKAQSGAVSPRRATGRVGYGDPLRGVVVTASGTPVPGALVTLRATSYQTTTDEDGAFVLFVPPSDEELEVAAWSAGYYIASVTTTAPADDLQFVLRRYHVADNPDYAWADPTPVAGSSSACGNCHPSIISQWSNNAHGMAISNPRFFSQYNGTDIDGNQAVPPGYVLDFPGTVGICATCHAPAAAVDAPFTTDMNAVRDQLTAGIHCDFCHKLGGAYLRGAEKMSVDCTSCHKQGGAALESVSHEVYTNSPGVLSLRVLRPHDGDNIFFGPYPDIHDPDTYLPLMTESAFCAACHDFSFWGTPIYTSYPEWLASSYSDPAEGQTCQDCHMPPNGDTHFALPEQGGLQHPPESIPSHLQLGAASQSLLQDTVDLDVAVEAASGRLDVTVSVTNSGAGHHVPTDHPGRHLLLVVDAHDGGGQPLTQLTGGTIPDWGGSFAGLPGTGFAKVLRDVDTGEAPVISYWKQALIESDNRIAALETDVSTYSFQLSGAAATVTVRVYFRRLFEPIADRYGWDLGGVVMEERIVTVD